MGDSRNKTSIWQAVREIRARNAKIHNTAGRTETNTLLIDIDGTVTNGIYIDNDGTLSGSAIRIDTTSGSILTMASSASPLVTASGTIPIELYTTTSDTSGTVTSGYIKLVTTANTRANQIEAFVVEVETEYETGDWCNAIVARLDYGTTGDAAGGMAAPLVSELNYGAHSYASGGGSNYVIDLEMNCPTNFVCDAGITAHPQAFLNIAIWGGATAIGTWEDYGFLFRTDGFDAAAGNIISVNSQTIRVRVEDDSGDPVTRYLMLSDTEDVLGFAISGGYITAAAASMTIYGGDTTGDALVLQGSSADATEKLTITGASGADFNCDVSISTGKDLRMEDNSCLFFGDSDDVRVMWSAGVLSFMPIVDNTGMITFGTGGRQMDVRFYGATSTAYCDWDNSASRWVFTSAHSQYKDGTYVYFGNDNDVKMSWGGAAGMRITYANHDTLNCEIGANSKNIDWKWWMGASGYVLFDVGNLEVNLSTMNLRIAGLSNRLYFGTIASGASIHSGTVDGRLDFNAPDGIYVNNHMRMVANYNLYLGNVDTAYFLNDTPGHMKGYGTQITLTTSLVNATALMLDAGTGGGGVAVRGHLRLWVTDTDGATEGQMWYDNSENKIKFYDGSTVRTVTSA